MLKYPQYFYRKVNGEYSTQKSININQYNKTINYKISNTNINNNINLIYPFTPSQKFANKFSADSGGNSQNSSDIKFEYNPSSLKDQILSPEDEDLYLNHKSDNNRHQINNINNNKEIYDDNYLLNYDLNNNKNKSGNNNKKILILDLDETLVHSSFYPFNYNGENIRPDISFNILFNNKYYDIFVLFRPYFKEFLNKMNKIFNIYIFTASIKEYAEPLLKKLDINNLIKKKLFRENCTLSEDYKYIKDLNTLNENLKNVILIDNNPNSFRYNKCNGIPIKTWHYEKNDRELIKIIPFLTFLSTVEDVREYIPKVIDDDEINYDKIDSILIKFKMKEENNNNKKFEKKLINIIRKNSNIKNKNYLNSKIKYNYPQLFTNDLSIKNNNIYLKDKILYNDEEENNKIFANSINFNKLEERKNNNYHTANINSTITDNKYLHSPATINFREPLNNINATKNEHNSNTIINRENKNANRVKKMEKNRYIRSKSYYYYNDFEGINNKFSTINFNLNNQMNNKNIKKGKRKSNSSSNTNASKIKNCRSYNIQKQKSSIYYENNNNNGNNFDYYLYTLHQNDTSAYFNTNRITNNNKINNNIKKSLDNNFSLSSRLVKIKINKNPKTQKSIQNKNDINVFKQQKQNFFRNKIRINKNKIENNKNEDNEYDLKYNNINIPSLDNNKMKIFKSKYYKQKQSSNNILKRNKNSMNKYTSASKTSDFNDNSNSNSNNINNLNKKIRCSTLNNRHMNNHKKIINQNFEENKNHTMEINKNIKNKFFNNMNSDGNNAFNLKGMHRKNKTLDNKKSENINYNMIKQKNNKIKNHLNRETNLLNKFMKEFNNSQNEIKLLNNQDKSREIYTQRESFNFLNNKKMFNYNYNYDYNTEEIINKQKHDFNKDNMYSNYERKNKAYKSYKLSKGGNNYLRKKIKNINYENNYLNFNTINKNNEIIKNYNNCDNVKNMKYSSVVKGKDHNTNRAQKYSEIENEANILMNNKNNDVIKLHYSYGFNKI